MADRNGYAPSIFPHKDGCCDLCRRQDRPLQRHEPFNAANRKRSKQLGCWMLICDECHRRIHQSDPEFAFEAKVLMQHAAMEEYGWTMGEFRQHFGKNYIWED